jgi:hypothetical protein
MANSQVITVRDRQSDVPPFAALLVAVAFEEGRRRSSSVHTARGQ